MEILQYRFYGHILNFTRHLADVRAYDFSFRLIRIQYDFTLIKVFQMHAEGVLYNFFHVHKFETFVYGVKTNLFIESP